jgi:hypothetical protein
LIIRHSEQQAIFAHAASSRCHNEQALSSTQSPLMMADPVWAYRKNYEPKEVLFVVIKRLQRKLAKLPEGTTSIDFLRAIFNGLWQTLEEKELVVITAHTTALMSEEQWLRCQQSAIARLREAA